MGDRRRVGLGVLVVVAIASSVLLPAQQAPTFRSGIELIEVDATVIDGDGNPIPDLQAADFSVTVDGSRASSCRRSSSRSGLPRVAPARPIPRGKMLRTRPTPTRTPAGSS